MAVREWVLDAGGHPETAVLHYKPTRTSFSTARPDYYVDETDAWIVYPWDVGEASLPAGVLESLSEA
jgi:hypoxanthine phosphoribosyltransferase